METLFDYNDKMKFFLHTKELIDLKDIKTKQKVQMIKTKDSKANIKHFIKQQTLHTRNKHNAADDLDNAHYIFSSILYMNTHTQLI